MIVSHTAQTPQCLAPRPDYLSSVILHRIVIFKFTLPHKMSYR
jgi:hypothetical protein